MKDWILHGISALEFLRTPPCIRELEFPPEVLESLNRASPSYRERSNTPQLILEIRHEIFRSLKGVSIPVHVLTDGIPRGASPYAVWHTRSDDISDDDLEQISDNLYATSPRVALLHMARDCTPVQLAMVMMECCGLYATRPGTSRMQRAINLLDTTCGLPDTTRQLAAFYGLDGKPLAFTDDHGAPLPWSPCRTRDGTISNLWKRPPLCSIEQLAKFSKSLGPVHGAKTFRRALEMVVAGAASPLEAQAALLMGINRKLGLEGLPPFQLNRRVKLSPSSASAWGSPICVVDIGWFDEGSRTPNLCCEVEGAAFHGRALEDDNEARRDDSARKTALRSMDIAVETITNSQIKNIERWDVLMDVLYRHLGIERPARTKRFMEQRVKLRKDLFEKPRL